jgi:hypothetical protein
MKKDTSNAGEKEVKTTFEITSNEEKENGAELVDGDGQIMVGQKGSEFEEEKETTEEVNMVIDMPPQMKAGGVGDSIHEGSSVKGELEKVLKGKETEGMGTVDVSEDKSKKGTFKRVAQTRGRKSVVKEVVGAKKRSPDDLEVDDKVNPKKNKVCMGDGEVIVKQINEKGAGLSEQLRRSQ